MIEKLIMYMMSNGYTHPLSPKLLMTPTGKEFANMIGFLFRKFDPNFKLQGKIEDEVPPVLQAAALTRFRSPRMPSTPWALRTRGRPCWARSRGWWSCSHTASRQRWSAAGGCSRTRRPRPEGLSSLPRVHTSTFWRARTTRWRPWRSSWQCSFRSATRNWPRRWRSSRPRSRAWLK